MILFYAPGASSLAPHILLRASGLPFALEKVDLASRQWSGGDFANINAKHYVPALQINGGDVLTECSVILTYISDQAPAHDLMPPTGRRERYRALEWLGFIATELHKNFIAPERHADRAANFLPLTAMGQAAAQARVTPRLAWVDQMMKDRDYLLGGNLSAPDAYLFVMLTWARRLNMDLSQWKRLRAFHGRLCALDAVQAALEAEGRPHSLQA